MPVILAVAIAFFVFAPVGVYAGNIDYAQIVENTDTEAIIMQRSLTDESCFRCAIATDTCTSVAKNTSITAPGATPAYMFAYRALMPGGASWLTRSPDGRYIAFYIPATASRNTRTFGVMDTVDLKIYKKTEKVSYWDLLTEGIRIFAFSPDSKTLLYIDDIQNHPTLYRVSLPGGLSGGTLTSTKMFSREYTVADVLWKDNDTIFFIANRDNSYAWALYEYALSSGTLTKVADNVSYAVNIKKAGDIYLYAEVSASGVRPKIYDPSAKTSRVFGLPDLGATETPGKAVTSLKNGLSGIFLLEESGHSDTLLVWLHGGPFRQAAVGYHPYFSYGPYDWALELAREADVAVLKIDYPGSAGYGRLFAESISGKIGVKDAKDTATAIADFAKRNGYKNVYLMGNSYGGYLALKLLVDNPAAYKGALSINGVTDWTTMLTALDNSIFNVQFFGTVGEGNYDLYAASSIYNRVERLGNQKIILMHGDKDKTVPYVQSKGLAEYLGSLKKNVTLMTLSGEDHVYKKPESFKLLCETTLAFVGRSSATCAL